MKWEKKCTCLYEEENGLEKTKSCRIPCTNQIEILKERKKAREKANKEKKPK